MRSSVGGNARGPDGSDRRAGCSSERVSAAAAAGYDQAKALNEQHRIAERAGQRIEAAGQAAASGLEQAKALNEQHRVTERIGQAAAGGWERAKQLNEEHKIAETAGQWARGAGQAVSDLLAKWDENQPHPGYPAPPPQG